MNARIIVCFLLCTIGLIARGQNDSVTRALTQRIVVLEGEKGIREGQLNVQTQQLKTDFESLKAGSDSQSMRIWIAIAFGLAFLGVSVIGILKFAKTYAQKLVQDKLDLELPPLIQQKMEESFEKLLKKHSQLIMDMIGERDRVEKLKREKRILILSEEKLEGEKLKRLLTGIGYDNVKAEIATDIPDPKSYDLLIFAREKAAPNAFENLTDAKIWEFYESLPPNRAFMYYGPPVNRFNAIPRDKIQFANIIFTLNSRILQVFEYEHAMDTVREDASKG